MSIIVNLDVMMAKRKVSLGELAEKMGITRLYDHDRGLHTVL